MDKNLKNDALLIKLMNDVLKNKAVEIKNDNFLKSLGEEIYNKHGNLKHDECEDCLTYLNNEIKKTKDSLNKEERIVFMSFSPQKNFLYEKAIKFILEKVYFPNKILVDFNENDMINENDIIVSLPTIFSKLQLCYKDLLMRYVDKNIIYFIDPETFKLRRLIGKIEDITNELNKMVLTDTELSILTKK